MIRVLFPSIHRQQLKHLLFCHTYMTAAQRKECMPPSPSDTISIPSIGLTFTPVEAPKPVVPQRRALSEFKLGDKIVPYTMEGFSISIENHTYTVVSDFYNVRASLSCSHITCNDLGRKEWMLRSDFEQVGGVWKLKTIPATPSLVPFRDLPQGAVFKAQGSTHLMRVKTDDTNIWWNVDSRYRPSPIHTATAFDSYPVLNDTLCEVLGYINK